MASGDVNGIDPERLSVGPPISRQAIDDDEAWIGQDPESAERVAMEKLGFTREDMAAFSVESAEVRTRMMEERLRPKLESISYRFAPLLSRLAGQPLAAVIQLPTDAGPRTEAIASFIKVGTDTVSDPYFSFVITRGGVHARVIVEKRCARKDEVARRLAKSATAIARELGDVELRCYDDWDGRGIPAPTSVSKAAFWKDVAGRLGRAAGSLDLGVGWPEARAVLLVYEDLMPAYRTLVPLYRRLSEVSRQPC